MNILIYCALHSALSVDIAKSVRPIDAGSRKASCLNSRAAMQGLANAKLVTRVNMLINRMFN